MPILTNLGTKSKKPILTNFEILFFLNVSEKMKENWKVRIDAIEQKRESIIT